MAQAKGNFDAFDNHLASPVLPSSWQSVHLPYHQPRDIDANNKGDDIVSYFFRFHLRNVDEHPQQSYALYIPRWQTIGLIKIYADNQLVFWSKTGTAWNGYNHPVWLTFKARQIPRQFIIRIDANRMAGLGMSKVYFDKEQKLYANFLVRTWLQTRLPETISSAMLLTGLFAFTIWLRKRDEWVYLLFFAVSLFSHLRCMQYFVGENPLIISETWFSWMVLNASGWTIVFTYAICSHLYQLKFKLLQWSLGAVMLLATLLTMPALHLSRDFGQIWSITSLYIFVFLLIYTSMMVIASWKSRSKEGGWLSLVFLSNIPLGIHDLMLQNYQINMEHIYLVPYNNICSMFILILIVRSRYLQAMKVIQLSNKHLESKLAEREKELYESYEIKKRQEKEQLLLHERERLMKDMHDGFGSTLSTTLILLKSGQIRQQQVEAYLEECISDLRLVIDSIEPDENTLDSALTNYAYRIQQKFAMADIDFSRQFDPIPLLDWITPTHSLHVLRIMQEVFANILKHASATQVNWQCLCNQQNITFIIQDNGIGFNLHKVKQNRGLKNIEVRSKFLKAHVEWQANSGGTKFIMTLPLRT